LSHDTLDEPAVQLEALAALLELFDGAVVFEPHDGDGVALPQRIGDAVEECANYGDELMEDHVAVLVVDWLGANIYQPRRAAPSRAASIAKRSWGSVTYGAGPSRSRSPRWSVEMLPRRKRC